jgi:hypothetical protein
VTFVTREDIASVEQQHTVVGLQVTSPPVVTRIVIGDRKKALARNDKQLTHDDEKGAGYHDLRAPMLGGSKHRAGFITAAISSIATSRDSTSNQNQHHLATSRRGGWGEIGACADPRAKPLRGHHSSTSGDSVQTIGFGWG